MCGKRRLCVKFTPQRKSVSLFSWHLHHSFINWLSRDNSTGLADDETCDSINKARFLWSCDKFYSLKLTKQDGVQALPYAGILR